MRFSTPSVLAPLFLSIACGAPCECPEVESQEEQIEDNDANVYEYDEDVDDIGSSEEESQETEGVEEEEVSPRIELDYIEVEGEYFALGHRVPVIEFSLTANVDAYLTQVPFRMGTTDYGYTDWNSCSNQGDSLYFGFYEYMGEDQDGYDQWMTLEANWDFYTIDDDEAEWVDCSYGPNLDVEQAVAEIDVELVAGETKWFRMAYEAAPSPCTSEDCQDDTVTSISWPAEFHWETAEGQLLDGLTVDGLPTPGQRLFFID